MATSSNSEEVAGRESGADLVAPSAARGVYGISVTSDLVGTGVQNLRAYERAGLVDPSRTAGGTRLYSPDDIARLRRIQHLLADGLNLAGISMVLDLQDANQQLQDQIDHDDAPHQTDQGSETM